MNQFKLIKGLKILGFVLVAGTAMSALFMVLWNALIPEIFGLQTLNFWQALGLLALSRLLFGGFGGRRGGRFRGDGRRWKQKWAKMNPEERAIFREKMRGKCGVDTRFMDEEARIEPSPPTT